MPRKPSLFSDCCGASPVSNGDNDSVDFGIYSSCGEHCNYISEDDFEEPEEKLKPSI